MHEPFSVLVFFPFSFLVKRSLSLSLSLSLTCKVPSGVIKSVDNGEEERIKYRTRDGLQLLEYDARVVWVDEGAGEEVVLPYNLPGSM